MCYSYTGIQVYKRNPVSIILHSNGMTVSIIISCLCAEGKRERVSTKCETELKI